MILAYGLGTRLNEKTIVKSNPDGGDRRQASILIQTFSPCLTVSLPKKRVMIFLMPPSSLMLPNLLLIEINHLKKYYKVNLLAYLLVYYMQIKKAERMGGDEAVSGDKEALK